MLFLFYQYNPCKERYLDYCFNIHAIIQEVNIYPHHSHMLLALTTLKKKILIFLSPLPLKG